MRYFKLAGYVFFAVALAACFYWWLKPSKLVAGASGMVEALSTGNADQLFGYCISDERSCSELNQDKIHSAWQIMIEPLIAKSKLVGKDRIDPDASQTQAVGTYRYVTADGDAWALNMIANQAEGGPKAEIIYTMLATASLFDDAGRANSTLTSSLALGGVHRYRSQLEAAGIRRIMLAPGNCITWDELEAMLSRGVPRKTKVGLQHDRLR